MSEELGRELGWEDTITKDADNFEPVPEGDYNFVIEKFERSRSSGEGKLPPCNMAVVYFKIQDRDREITIRENYVLHSSLEWKLSELFRGVGLKNEGEPLRMNWSMLPGKTGKAKVGLKSGIKDPSKRFNFIEKLYPYELPKFQPGRF